MKNIV
jgi:hypothetical protein